MILFKRPLGARCQWVFVLIRLQSLRLVFVLLALIQAPKAALAEIDLGSWRTHAAMAEQGAVCGAFADLMAMQMLVDEKVGRLWTERRAYSGSVILRAAELEGQADVDSEAVDELLNRYAMWLLNNLANTANAEILDPVARDAASDMIGDVCAGLYAQADRAILKQHPSLGSCAPGQAPLPALSTRDEEPAKTCEGGDAILAATTIKQAEDAVEDMLKRLETERTRTTALNNELAVLQTDNDRLHREVATKRILSTKVDDLSQSNEDLRTEVGELRAERDRLSDDVAEIADLTLQNDALRAETARLADELTAELAARTSMAAELARLRLDNEQLAGRLVDTNTALQAAEATITTLPSLDEMADRTAEVAAARDEVQRLAAERDTLQSELANATAILETVTRTRSPNSQTPTTRSQQQNGLALLDSELDVAPAQTPIMSQIITQRQPAQTAISGEPNFIVQLGAFRSKSGALSEIGRLQLVFPGNVDLAALNVASGEDSTGASVYRIMTNAMQVTHAERLCSLLWTDMVSCVLKAAP